MTEVSLKPLVGNTGVDISIIIASWNAKDFLAQCLASIYDTIRQFNFEVLVIDNDSLDGSPELVEARFPQVKLIRTGMNVGFAKANNIGMKESRGRYLCLVNSDIKLLSGGVDVMVSYMEDHPEVGMVGPRVLNPDLSLQRSYEDCPTYWSALCRALALDTVFPRSKLFGGCDTLFTEDLSPRRIDVLRGCFWVVSRQAVCEVGLLDESFFIYDEDTDWCQRFALAGWKVMYIPEAQVIHYEGGSSSNAPIRLYIQLRQSTFVYWKKHHGRYGVTYIYLVTILHEVIRVIRSTALIPILNSGREQFKRKAIRSFVCILWLIRFPGYKKLNDYSARPL